MGISQAGHQRISFFTDLLKGRSLMINKHDNITAQGIKFYPETLNQQLYALAVYPHNSVT